jgi:hypothetical protein
LPAPNEEHGDRDPETVVHAATWPAAVGLIRQCDPDPINRGVELAARFVALVGERGSVSSGSTSTSRTI